MLLVASGRDFHIERAYGTLRIKHATSLGDLEKERVSLTTKLNFPKENGILELTSIIDTEVRNAIAHLRLNFKGNLIYIRRKPAHVLSYIGSRKLLKAIMAVNKLVEQLVTEASKEKGE